MSSTSTKRSFRQALADAEAFRALFPRQAYERWEFAGSLRRRRAEVGDVEHVVIPAFGDVPGAGLFAERTNLVFHHLDRLIDQGMAAKHLYGTSGYRWGQKYRGADFHGHLHELFCAGPDNWGPTLAIRTGPAEFSQKLVSGLLRQQRRNKDGAVWNCVRCVCEGRDKLCDRCEGYGLVPTERLIVPDERTYFELCGVAWVKPEER